MHLQLDCLPAIGRNRVAPPKSLMTGSPAIRGGDYAKSAPQPQVASCLHNKEAVSISLIKKELHPFAQIIRLPSVSSN
jgi:hypothetical protein